MRTARPDNSRFPSERSEIMTRPSRKEKKGKKKKKRVKERRTMRADEHEHIWT